MVRVLLEHGADCNKKNNSGSTPLHLAAKNNHPAIVRSLIKKGAGKRLQPFFSFISYSFVNLL